MINCPNPSCKTANPEGNDTCQVCQSAIPHRYLWGVGALVETLKPGALLNGRYLLKRDHIFLDTQPGLVPESLLEVPDFLLPYLHLSAYPLHMPRPYAVMQTPDRDYVVLLESSALATATKADEIPTQLPTLSESWIEAPPLRQLSWLWQIAYLWDAFQAEQVAATLLDESFLRVDRSILRLRELSSPSTGERVVQAITKSAPKQPTLLDLSRSWQPLVERAHQAVRVFLDRICEQIDRRQLNAEQLTEQLSQAISMCALGQVVGYDMAVYTDQGPTRKRNEDACYPKSGTIQTLTSEQTKTEPQLLIVCDGIGGHQGGDVASKLAIATIESRLQPLLSADSIERTSTEIMLAIEAAICAANDEISAQNDQAQRQARDRMGTTLVLALVQGANVYIAHLGDSRAYRVAEYNCQQVTLDDDVACRQVRLGGSLYREVLTQPGSGSLIQALGMSSSQTLRPTVQRFVMDESCVFLLCSDGLSDSDRVEQFWQQVLRPLALENASGQSTAAVGKQLVDLANKYNGHDNVTVGLLTAQVIRASERRVPKNLASLGVGGSMTGRDAAIAGRANRGTTKIVQAQPGESRADLATPELQSGETSGNPSISAGREAASESAPTSLRKPAVTPSDSSSGQAKKIGAIVALLAALAGGLYFLFPGLSWRFTAGLNEPGDTSSAVVEPSSRGAIGEGSTPGGVARSPADIQVGTYLRVLPNLPNRADPNRTDADGQIEPLRLYPNPTISNKDLAVTVPTGSIARVVEQATEGSTEWVRLTLCSIPSGASLADVPAETDTPLAPSAPIDPEALGSDQPLPLDAGNQAWVVKSTIANVSESIKDLQPTQQGSCGS